MGDTPTSNLPSGVDPTLRLVPMPADTNAAGDARVGRTSITILVEVCAERARPPHGILKVTEATVTFVAMDENRKPRRVDAEIIEA